MTVSDYAQEHAIGNKAGFGKEWPLAASVATMVLFFIFSKSWFEHLANPFWFTALFGWLIIVILSSAFAIVRHAETLAEHVGEPLGTLILTLAVTGLEVMMIAAVMYGGTGETTMARDAMFAVIMLVLNGMVGVSLVVGGLRYREQTYNLMGANAFLAVIVPLAVIGLVFPNYTMTTPGPTFSTLQSIFIIVMSLGLYAIFLAMQTVRHRAYFVAEESSSVESHAHGGGSVAFHTFMLFAYLLPVVLLAKKLAIPINHAVNVLHAPPALGGLLVAVLILSPESLAAVRAALSESITAIGESSARFGVGDDRPDYPGCAVDRVHHPSADRAWPQSNQYASVGTDIGGQHAHVCRHSNQCVAWRGAHAVVPGVRDTDL